MNAQESPQGFWRVRYTILCILLAGWLFSFLDRMIMSVSLPFIGKDLGLETTEQGLIISAFFLAYAGFQIPGGWLVDRVAPRLLYALGQQISKRLLDTSRKASRLAFLDVTDPHRDYAKTGTKNTVTECKSLFSLANTLTKMR
mgnify:CR=1 FL=1